MSTPSEICANALESFLNSKNILGDSICGSIAASLASSSTPVKEDEVKEFVAALVENTKYEEWNETSVGNLLLFHRAIKNTRCTTAIENHLRNFLLFHQGRKQRQQNYVSVEMRDIMHRIQNS